MGARYLSDYRTLASISRINLLHELQQNGPKTVNELAELTGLHHNTAREHLHRLIDAGFVSVETIPSVGRGRPQLRYHAARDESDSARLHRQELGERRTAQLRRLLSVTDAPSERTPETRQLDALDDHMEQCGFDAEISEDHTHMTMYDCPFEQLAKTNPQVCQVHLALIEDSLKVEGGPLRAKELSPLCATHTCKVQLHDSAAAPAGLAAE